MTPGVYVALTSRECRSAGGRLVYFIACLGIGVAAVVVVASLTRSIDAGVRTEAKELLAADIAISGNNPPPDILEKVSARYAGIERTDIREQPMVVAAGGGRSGSLLVELKIIDGEYPFYGSLELDPPKPLHELLTSQTAVVAPEVLSKLRLSIGDTLAAGGAEFRIVGVAHAEPDRITGFMYIGPRVFLSADGFRRTNVGDMGARIRYKTLLKTPGTMGPEALAGLVAELEGAFREGPYLRVESYAEGRPSIRRGLQRMEHFLGLVALLSLLLGGVGVAQAMRGWIASRLDAIAILKCVGMRPREILALYAGQAVLLGLAGSAAGALAGLAFLYTVPPLFREHIPVHLIDPWQPSAVVRGLSLGVAIAFVFSFPALVGILRVAPSRVFRRDAEPLPETRRTTWITGAVVVGGILLLAFVQAGSARLAMQFIAGVLGTGLALLLAAYGLTRGMARLPREAGSVWLRHGLAALGRPGASTIASVVGLGLGLLVLFCTGLVQSHLNAQLSTELPENLPTAFMIDVRPEQWPALKDSLEAEGATDVRMAPLVMARMIGMNGRDFREASDEGPDDGDRREGRLRRMARREQWLTYFEELPGDNSIIAGQWWSDPDRYEVSLEEEFARRIRADLGATLTFLVNNQPRDFVVTSLRRAEWLELGTNFEIVAEPGSLDDAPQLRLATAKLPDGRGQAIQDAVIAAFPNVTMVQVSDVIERISLQLRRLGWGVRFLALFIIASGVAVLVGTIGVESRRRGKEVALLKTLGMTRKQVAALFATEYALIGLLAGVIATAGGGLTAWWIIRRAMEIPWHFKPTLFALALISGMALAVAAGIGASAGALRRRPIEVLRQE